MPEALVVALPPPLSVTVAPEIGAVLDALVTVPVTDPAAGARVKLMFWVVCPALTLAVSVCGLKAVAEAVSVWLPALRPERVYTPEALVVVVAPPLSVTVAPAMTAPPDALVTRPVTAPVVGGGERPKLTFAGVRAAGTMASRARGLKPAAVAVRVWLPGVNPDTE